MENFYFIVGLAFFLLTSITILRDHNVTQDRYDRRDRIDYERKLAEAREFGYEGSRLQNEEPEQK